MGWGTAAQLAALNEPHAPRSAELGVADRVGWGGVRIGGCVRGRESERQRKRES